jgi:hypothetical protein
MTISTRLHHSAYKISTDSLEIVLEAFKLLGCEVTFRPKNKYVWAMVGQVGLRYDIQLVETDERPILTSESKTGTHVAFISDDPQSKIEEIREWAFNKKIKFIAGGWSEKELYFDLPELFINFVVEIMHTSVEE